MTLVLNAAGEQSAIILSGTTPTDVATFPLTGQPSVTFALTGTWSGTVTFEARVDGTWLTLGVTKVSDGTTVSTSTTTGLFAVTNTGFAAVRARCSTYSSGSIIVHMGSGAW